jgi:hypothetical protein
MNRRRRFVTYEACALDNCVRIAATAVGAFLIMQAPQAELSKAIQTTNNAYAFEPPRGWVRAPMASSFPTSDALGSFNLLGQWTPVPADGSSIVLGREVLSGSFAEYLDSIVSTIRHAHPRAEVANPVQIELCGASATSYDVLVKVPADGGPARHIEQVYTYAAAGDFTAVAALTFDPMKGRREDVIASLRSLCPRILRRRNLGER